MNTNRRIPIGDYGLIGDTRTAALVAGDGSIDWMCLPRFDSAPVFGRLVGGEEGGCFAIGPDEPGTVVGRRYRGDTTTLETTWAVDGGRITLADSMVGEVSERMLPDSMLVRRITSQGRAIRTRVEINPRFGYKQRSARRVRRQDGSLVIDHGDIALAVSSDAAVELTPDRPAVLEVTPDRPVTVVMSAAYRGPLLLVPPLVAAEQAERDETRWQRWADTLITGPHHRSAMVRSLITIQLLTYSPSGAPVAAPTTSLPETVGGG
ncbi:MAG TPA: trehalase-like domain-containing protein, partial [Acidimicrobiia bacterium]